MHKNKTEIKPFEAVVTVHDISDVIIIPRKDNVDLKKVELIVETEDGQVFFPELRYNKIEYLKELNVKVKDKVRLIFTFQGSQKNGKKYNNIYIVGITKEGI